MKYFVIVVFVLSLVGCSDIDSAQQYLQQIQALNESNKKLHESNKKLREKVGAATAELSSAREELEQLRKKNETLEKMSEERIRKFWSMYETDA